MSSNTVIELARDSGRPAASSIGIPAQRGAVPSVPRKSAPPPASADARVAEAMSRFLLDRPTPYVDALSVQLIQRTLWRRA
ncbi:MAG: hypothetical protein CSA58_08600 [Micrococcales bacterium]|nr:MAG: hypothetical protein CSB46_00845 [Micrococcales bacterium]PIE26615.1 MAG: hypothetical protein CSA58_08600 [Micrococcales bacterium]